MLTKAIFGRLWERACDRHDAPPPSDAALVSEMIDRDGFAGTRFVVPGTPAGWEPLAEAKDGTLRVMYSPQPLDDWLTGKSVVAEIRHWWRSRQ
jgi:hypothetical protein